MEKDVTYNESCETGIPARLPDESVNCIVTSPPYWMLRDYGHPDQIGMEDTPEQYVDRMVAVFESARQKLRPEGTLWLNLGDSYASAAKKRTREQAEAKSTLDGRKNGCILTQKSKIVSGLKPKDLVGIPWLTAFALRAAGWYLRQDIIWYKLNPMPESVTDRFTKAHEYIFLFSKSKEYYFDQEAVKVPIRKSTAEDSRLTNENYKTQRIERGHPGHAQHGGGLLKPHGDKANRRSVLPIGLKPGSSEDHFAAYPQDIPNICILAGCPEGGIVLDPFMGTHTTALVAKKLNRHYVGFELNEKDIIHGQKRINKAMGLFA